MKTTELSVKKTYADVISAYEFHWGESTSTKDYDDIRDFFKKSVDMDYNEFISLVNAEYGELISNYQNSVNQKNTNTIKSILTFFLVINIIGIVVGLVIVLFG